MTFWSIILFTIGFIALLESLIVLLFPKKTTIAIKKIIKNKNDLKKIGILELAFALILILIAIII